MTADTSECGITLLHLPFAPDAQPPKFKDCAKRPRTSETGFVIYYTDQCPFTYYWVPRVAEVAAEHGIPLKTIHITDRETAQNLPAPVTTYALFRGWKICDTRNPVRQEVFETGTRGVTLDQKKCNVCLKSDPKKCKNRP